MSETDYFVSGKTGLTDSIRVCASDLSRDVCHPDKCKPLRADCFVQPVSLREPAEILRFRRYIRYMDSLPEDKFYPYAEETEKILACVFDVYHYFGPGFLESVYHKCLEIELAKAEIPFESEKKLKIFYKGEDIGMRFSADLVIDNKIILELKAKDRLKTEDEAQILHYLKISGYPLGLLINFGSKRKAEVRQFINVYPPVNAD